MKIGISRVCGILFTFAFLFLSLAGCDVNFGRPANDNYISNRYDREENFDAPDFDIKDYIDIETPDTDDVNNMFSDMSENYTGVRLLTTPLAGETSGASQTDLERERFYFNVANQYEVMAKYILTGLVGNFGLGSDLNVIESEPFSNQSTGDYVVTTGTYQPEDRSSSSGFKDDNNQLVIESFATGWEIEHGNCTPVYNEVTGQYECSGNHDYSVTKSIDYGWEFKLDNNEFTNAQDYLQTYINNYATYVQMRIMEIKLGLPATSWYQFSSIKAEETIKEYSYQVNRLGLSFTNAEKNDIKQFFMNNVIGQTAQNYATSTKSFIEPSYVENFTYTDDTDPENPVQVTVPITHYCDVDEDGRYGETITNLQMYRTDYDMVLETLLLEFYEKANEFVDYFAVEVKDISSESFFQVGDGVDANADDAKLNNIPMDEYKSVILLGEQITSFAAVQFMFSSEYDMLIDVYIHAANNGVEVFEKLCSSNVSASQSFMYYEEDEEYADFNYATATDEEIDEKQLSEMFNTNVIRNTTEYLWVEYVVEESESEIFDNDIELSGEYNTLIYAQDATHNGYHTNAKENTNISPSDKFEGQLYSQITKDENSYIGANSNNSSVNFIEFVFDVKKSDPTQKLPFNFIVNLIHN